MGPIHKGYRTYTKAIVSSDDIRSCYAEAFHMDISKIKATGFPRTDMFFNDQYKENIKKSFYQRHPRYQGKKIILFAPTYRGAPVSKATYDFSKIDFLALLLSGVIFVLRIIYLNRFNDFSLNAARPILWISWDISMIVMPVLLFNIYSDSIYPNAQLVITPKDINFSILIGVMVLTIHFFASYFYKNDKYSNTDYYPSISEMMFWILAVMGATLWFCALVAAKYFGTGTFNMEGNLLPYKMSGIINFFAYYFPSFYVLFLLDGVLKFKRNIFLALIPILGLSALTAYVSLSKAAIIRPVVMIALYIVLSRRMTFWFAITGVTLLFFAFLSGSYIASFRDSLNSIRYKTWNEMTADYGALD